MRYAQRDNEGNLRGKFIALQSWMLPNNEQVEDDAPLWYPPPEEPQEP